MNDTISAEDMERFRTRVVGRSISEDTFEAYRLWIERFEQWFNGDEPGLRDLEDFDTMLEDPTVPCPWVNQTGRPAPSGYSYSSRNQAISAVKKWVRRQYGVDIPEQPGDIVMGTEEAFTPTYLSPERVRETIEEAPDACNCDGCAAALATSYDAVLRASEMVLLSTNDIDFEDGVLDVTATKKSRDSQIALSADTVEMVRDYLSRADHSSGALFRNTYGDSWNKNSWSTHVIRHHVPEGSHAWGRHTPILHQLEAGVSFGDVYRRARHKSPSTTARYARYVDVDVPSWTGE